MSLFDIDRQKCTKCGTCAEVCSVAMIELNNNLSFPTADNKKKCINCGHCLAACPHEALSLEKMPLDRCPPVQENLIIPPQQLEHNLQMRRSIRAYLDKPVDRDLLAQAIDITRFAPTMHNHQPVHWIVVYEKNEVTFMVEKVIDCIRYLKRKEQFIGKIDELSHLLTEYESGIDHISYNAPHLIVTHTNIENSIFSMTGIQPSTTDCITALTHLELILPSLGLGSCRARYFDLAVELWPPLQNALGFPRSHRSCGALFVGYPKHKYHRLPIRNKPSVTWL